ncbi:nuclear transport factor 2 family protein [Turneriella parva]|uniref:DUF4440 domain-containing protein n=1 Tax=Turneriella parva (strain ATCC BAA-1111 / DSM 21527 / NCTC 11395 / H) TaxID=869212 RepID=I4B3Y0_TURPD|nr:nuclear transport factor 2 family protein [Turneriella parva]AFM11987.1 hypothetical protein Turpa_1339 [Turneriella parva DSM 21527]
MHGIQKSAITELEERLVDYIKTSDTDQLDKVLHDDLLFIAPNGTVVTKAMDMASHKAGDMIVHSLVLKIEQISTIGDTAISITVYETNGVMLGQSIQGKFRYIRVWQEFPDGFKVIGGSCCKI